VLLNVKIPGRETLLTKMYIKPLNEHSCHRSYEVWLAFKLVETLSLIWVCYKSLVTHEMSVLQSCELFLQGELLTIYNSLKPVRDSGLYSISLPNKLNFSLDYHLVLIGTIPFYVICKCYLACSEFCGNASPGLRSEL